MFLSTGYRCLKTASTLAQNPEEHSGARARSRPSINQTNPHNLSLRHFRAYPNYSSETSLQRWHQELLRNAMESEGFTVHQAEWWHFDYKDWQKYPIMNVRFESI